MPKGTRRRRSSFRRPLREVRHGTSIRPTDLRAICIALGIDATALTQTAQKLQRIEDGRDDTNPRGGR
jgi:hypothetical protein